MAARAGLIPFAALIAAAGQGAASGMDMTEPQRRAFGAEVRAVLMAHPELAAPALAQSRSAPGKAIAPYAENIRRDLDLIDRYASDLFGSGLPGFGEPGARAAVAFFTRPGCPDCAAAEADLRRLARDLGLRVTLRDITEQAALAAALGLDMAPSYVLPHMMLRGRMPAVVLERYLTR